MDIPNSDFVSTGRHISGELRHPAAVQSADSFSVPIAICSYSENLNLLTKNREAQQIARK
jgi:hypothetical protein